MPWRRVVLIALMVAVAVPAVAQPSAKQIYADAMAREKSLRTAWESGEGQPATASLKQARAIVAAYEALVRRYPTSGYCDNALWQAARLAADVFGRSQQEADRRRAARLFEFLAREYPTSPLVNKAVEQARDLQGPAVAASSTVRDASVESAGRADSTPGSATPAATAVSTVREIKRTVLADVVRVSIELDREVEFRQDRVENPPRLLFDLPSTKTTRPLQDASWSYTDDIVRHIRVGRHANQTTRVVLDLEGVSRYSVTTLYNPYRILVDCEREKAVTAEPARPQQTMVEQKPAAVATARPEPARPEQAPSPRKPDSPAMAPREGPRAEAVKPDSPKADAPTPEEPKPDAPAPLARTTRDKRADTAAEKTGAATGADHNRVSMARQLGLGVSRIVIDPGHGGHDPGAEGDRVVESEVVLDIALRLEKLLTKQRGVEVVLTRRTDVFVPLEERTEIANREQADLFLSIHANASRNLNARGIETYYLNFASNPDAEEVAARENAASDRTMNKLTDIVKAITLNNKLDESKDFAGLVQQALARQLRSSNKSLKNLGVKKAPFVVLIGAGMPSVLAEVSFVTNKREGQLLRNDAYRQRIAEALADAILRYKRGLKSASVMAHQ